MKNLLMALSICSALVLSGCMHGGMHGGHKCGECMKKEKKECCDKKDGCDMKDGKHDGCDLKDEPKKEEGKK